MDDIIDLWTKMMEAEQVRVETIVSNVEAMQREADQSVRILREELGKLHATALTAVANEGRSVLYLQRVRVPTLARLPVTSCSRPRREAVAKRARHLCVCLLAEEARCFA